MKEIRVATWKITPTWNGLPTISRKFPQAKITTLTVYRYIVEAGEMDINQTQNWKVLPDVHGRYV